MQEKTPIVLPIPSDWFNDINKSSIWIVGYRMMQSTQQDFSHMPLIVDLGDVRAIFIYGTLSYVDNFNMLDYSDNHVFVFQASKVQPKESNVGSWTVLITPYISDGHERPEPEIRNSISEAEGLLAALNSRNMIYSKVFENWVDLSSRNTSGASPTIINSRTDPIPNLTTPALQVLAQSSVNLQALPESIQNRVKLSLRWYSKSLTEMDIDGFLSLWVAIEVIGMPNTSNIRPLNEALAKIYHLDGYKSAQNRFQLGKIQDVRSKIVHDGKMFPIHFLLSKYLEAIYIDLLLETLNLPPEKRAEQILNNPQFNLGQYININ